MDNKVVEGIDGHGIYERQTFHPRYSHSIAADEEIMKTADYVAYQKARSTLKLKPEERTDYKTISDKKGYKFPMIGHKDQSRSIVAQSFNHGQSYGLIQNSSSQNRSFESRYRYPKNSTIHDEIKLSKNKKNLSFMAPFTQHVTIGNQTDESRNTGQLTSPRLDDSNRYDIPNLKVSVQSKTFSGGPDDDVFYTINEQYQKEINQVSASLVVMPNINTKDQKDFNFVSSKKQTLNTQSKKQLLDTTPKVKRFLGQYNTQTNDGGNHEGELSNNGSVPYLMKNSQGEQRKSYQLDGINSSQISLSNQIALTMIKKNDISRVNQLLDDQELAMKQKEIPQGYDEQMNVFQSYKSIYQQGFYEIYRKIPKTFSKEKDLLERIVNGICDTMKKTVSLSNTEVSMLRKLNEQLKQDYNDIQKKYDEYKSSQSIEAYFLKNFTTHEEMKEKRDVFVKNIDDFLGEDSIRKVWDSELAEREMNVNNSQFSGVNDQLEGIIHDLKGFKEMRRLLDFVKLSTENPDSINEQLKRKQTLTDIQTGVSTQMENIQKMTAKKILQKFVKHIETAETGVQTLTYDELVYSYQKKIDQLNDRYDSLRNEKIQLAIQIDKLNDQAKIQAEAKYQAERKLRNQLDLQEIEINKLYDDLNKQKETIKEKNNTEKQLKGKILELENIAEQKVKLERRYDRIKRKFKHLIEEHENENNGQISHQNSFRLEDQEHQVNNGSQSHIQLPEKRRDMSNQRSSNELKNQESHQWPKYNPSTTPSKFQLYSQGQLNRAIDSESSDRGSHRGPSGISYRNYSKLLDGKKTHIDTDSSLESQRSNHHQLHTNNINIDQLDGDDNSEIEEIIDDEEIGHNKIMLDTRYHSKEGTKIDQSIGKNSMKTSIPLSEGGSPKNMTVTVSKGKKGKKVQEITHSTKQKVQQNSKRDKTAKINGTQGKVNASTIPNQNQSRRNQTKEPVNQKQSVHSSLERMTNKDKKYQSTENEFKRASLNNSMHFIEPNKPMNIIDQEDIIDEGKTEFRDTSHFPKQKYPINQSQIVFGGLGHRSSSIGEQLVKQSTLKTSKKSLNYSNAVNSSLYNQRMNNQSKEKIEGVKGRNYHNMLTEKGDMLIDDNTLYNSQYDNSNYMRTNYHPNPHSERQGSLPDAQGQVNITSLYISESVQTENDEFMDKIIEVIKQQIMEQLEFEKHKLSYKEYEILVRKAMELVTKIRSRFGNSGDIFFKAGVFLTHAKPPQVQSSLELLEKNNKGIQSIPKLQQSPKQQIEEFAKVKVQRRAGGAGDFKQYGKQSKIQSINSMVPSSSLTKIQKHPLNQDI